jgi:hypothetical protein
MFFEVELILTMLGLLYMCADFGCSGCKACIRRHLKFVLLSRPKYVRWNISLCGSNCLLRCVRVNVAFQSVHVNQLSLM